MKNSDKKSFVLHKDSLVILDEMSDEQAGAFLKIIYQYQTTGELPSLDFAMKMAITPFINQFKRDDEGWGKKKEKKSIAGRIGNLSKYHKDLYLEFESKKITLEEAEKVAKSRKVSQCDKEVANIAVNVSGSVSGSVSGNVNVNDNKKTKAKKAKPKFNDFHFQVAKQLGQFVKESKKINLKVGDVKRWANDIRLLQEQELKPRTNSKEDIIKAMQSVLDNSGSEYFPVIESGAAFRKKFTGIENFGKNNNSNQKYGCNF